MMPTALHRGLLACYCEHTFHSTQIKQAYCQVHACTEQTMQLQQPYVRSRHRTYLTGAADAKRATPCLFKMLACSMLQV